MSELSDAFLTRAQESLLGAESEFLHGRYNNVANRTYYACFQAAIAALDLADIHPLAGKSGWGHAFVRSQFSGVLVGRRKRYPSELRETLTDGIRLRGQADYNRFPVNRSQASRILNRARIFVDAISRAAGRTE